MRDFTAPGTISAELEGISCLVCALYELFSKDKIALSNDTIADALFAIECYLERISDDVGEFRRRNEGHV